MADVLDETMVLGRSVRERMADHPGPYAVRPASVKGTWDRGAVIYGRQGFNMLGIIFIDPGQARYLCSAMNGDG